MGVSLTKGQTINLTKETQGLSKVVVGLGWQKAEKKANTQQKTKKKGLLGRWFSSNATISTRPTADIDCDAVAYLIDETGRIETIYYGYKRHSSNCVIHMGDNLVGSTKLDAGKYVDAEQIKINLADLPKKYNRIVLGVNIFNAYTRHQDFGMVEKAFIRLVNEETGEQLCNFDLTEEYAGKTGMIMGELLRENNEWKFRAVGSGFTVANLEELKYHC